MREPRSSRACRSPGTVPPPSLFFFLSPPRSHSLTALGIGYGEYSSEALRACVGALPHLRTLRMPWVQTLDDQALGAIGATCASLTSIDITGARNISTEGVTALLERKAAGVAAAAAGSDDTTAPALKDDFVSTSMTRGDDDEPELPDEAVWVPLTHLSCRYAQIQRSAIDALAVQHADSLNIHAS